MLHFRSWPSLCDLGGNPSGVFQAPRRKGLGVGGGEAYCTFVLGWRFSKRLGGGGWGGGWFCFRECRQRGRRSCQHKKVFIRVDVPCFCTPGLHETIVAKCRLVFCARHETIVAKGRLVFCAWGSGCCGCAEGKEEEASRNSRRYICIPIGQGEGGGAKDLPPCTFAATFLSGRHRSDVVRRT